MASYFNLSPVKEFAKHITNATSEERQKMLRDFYASRFPEVKECFVDSAVEFIKPAYEEGKRVRNKSEKRETLIKERLPDSETLSFKDSTKKTSQIGSTKTYKEKSIKPQNHGFCKEVLSNDAETKKLRISSAQETDNGKNSISFYSSGFSLPFSASSSFSFFDQIPFSRVKYYRSKVYKDFVLLSSLYQ